jgi:hypothetical protein
LVEKDEVEGFGPQTFEGGASIRRGGDGVALSLKLTADQVAIGGLVVDDEDAAGDGGGAGGDFKRGGVAQQSRDVGGGMDKFGGGDGRRFGMARAE